MQIQGIEEVSAISVIGTIGMAWALGVSCGQAVHHLKGGRLRADAAVHRSCTGFGDVPELLVAVFDTRVHLWGPGQLAALPDVHAAEAQVPARGWQASRLSCEGAALGGSVVADSKGSSCLR